MDFHYGNGTASLAVDRPYLFTLSIYGNDYRANETFRDVKHRASRRRRKFQSIALVGLRDENSAGPSYRTLLASRKGKCARPARCLDPSC
jgi:hypothetical protein